MARVIDGTPVVAGTAEGPLLVADEPLSFWGGYDAATGEIIDRRHPLSGRQGAGAVLVLPGSRGSSTGSAVLLEAVRRGRAPAALVTDHRDDFFALAAIVAEAMYARSFPVLVVRTEDVATLRRAHAATITPDGRLALREEGDVGVR